MTDPTPSVRSKKGINAIVHFARCAPPLAETSATATLTPPAVPSDAFPQKPSRLRDGVVTTLPLPDHRSALLPSERTHSSGVPMSDVRGRAAATLASGTSWVRIGQRSGLHCCTNGPYDPTSQPYRSRCVSSLNARPYLIAADYREGFEADGRLVRVLDGLLVVALCLLLAFGPLAFGAVQEWAMFVLEVGAAGCVVLWVLRELISDRVEVRRNALFLPITLFAALVCAQLLAGRTAYWYVTWRSGLLWAAYGMIFFIATQCLRRTVWIKTFALFFMAFGFLVALFAMVQQFTWNGNLYWVVPNRYGGMVYGPYVNHAHYAGLMELLVPIPLVFAMMNRWTRSLRVLFGFVALLMASTIFLSRSLGGMIAFGAQMVVLCALAFFREPSRRRVPLILLIVASFAVWLALLSPGGIGERIARLHDPLGKAGAGDRLAIVKDSLKMVASRPVLGWGLGTFPEIYPSFRSFYTNYFVNEAHNDYVQMAVETGLIGFALGCWFIALFFSRGLSRIESWRTEVRAAATLASIIGVTGILVHSLSDFNLQIPANAALFFALAALATGSPDAHVARSREHSQ